MHDGRLDLAGELVGARLGEVLEGQARGLAVGGVGLGHERGEAAGGEVRVRLAEAELTPLGMAVGRPAGRVLGQGEDVGEAQRLLGPAEGLGHRSGHRDHEGRELERHEVAGHRGVALVLEALVEHRPPGGRGGRPDDRPGPFGAPRPSRWRGAGRPRRTTSPAPARTRTRRRARRPSLPLKSSARSVRRSSFSGDTDRSTTMQSPGSARSERGPVVDALLEHAAASSPSATSEATSVRGDPRCISWSLPSRASAGRP